MANSDWEEIPQDEWEEIPIEEAPTQEPSLAKSALTAVGEGLTLRHGGELSGLLQKLAGQAQQAGGYVLNKPEWVQAAQPTVDQPLPEIVAEEEGRITKEMEAHPGVTTPLQFASSLIPQTIATAALGPVGGAALTGALETEGAATSLGGKLAGLGAGAVLGGAAGKYAPQLVSKAGGFASKAFGALGEKGKAIMRRTIFTPAEEAKLGKSLRTGVNKANQYIETLTENGLFESGMSKPSLMKTAGEIAEKTGGEIGDLYSKSNAFATLDELATKFSPVEEKLTGKLTAEARKDVQDAFSDIVSKYSSPDGTMSLQQLWDAKKFIGDRTFKTGVPKDVSGLEKVYHTLGDLIDDTLIKQGGPEATQLQALNELHSAAQTVSGHLLKRVEADAGKTGISLREMLLGGGLLYGLGPVAGTAAVVAGYATKKYGPQAMYRTTHSLQSLAQSAPEKFGKYAPAILQLATRGQAALSSGLYIMLTSDPAFRKQVEPLVEKEEETEE